MFLPSNKAQISDLFRFSKFLVFNDQTINCSTLKGKGSMLDKKRILLHLPLELLPTDNGSKSKHLSFLKYLNNRREFLEV